MFFSVFSMIFFNKKFVSSNCHDIKGAVAKPLSIYSKGIDVSPPFLGFTWGYSHDASSRLLWKKQKGCCLLI